MPLITFETPDLLIDLPDLLVNDVVIAKQKALFLALVYEPTIDKLIIKVKVIPYANNHGEYGEPLDDGKSMFISREIELVSSNDNLVNCETGVKVCRVSEEYLTGETEEDPLTFNPLLEGIKYAKQVEYWKHVAANSPVVLNAAIQSNIIANFL